MLGGMWHRPCHFAWGELKEYGIFFDELCLLMTGFDRGQRVPRTTIHFAHYVRSVAATRRCWILDSGCSYLVNRRRGGDG